MIRVQEENELDPADPSPLADLKMWITWAADDRTSAWELGSLEC